MKRKRKVKLPCDRNGTPIHVGDWLMFEDGPFHIELLTYYGESFKGTVGGCWTAEDEGNNFCDNLANGVVVTYKEDA